MRIYARNCQVKKITNKEAKEFLDNYHKQKSINAEYSYGLFFEGELVQVETFGHPRIEEQNGIIWHDWELLRECSKESYQVVGGKSKLLKAFERTCKPIALLSYCNKTLGFDGHSYIACGFIKERETTDYYYTFEGRLIKRYSMQKNRNLREKGLKEPIQKTLEMFGKTYYPEKSERENAELAGFERVQGLGQIVFSKYYSKDIGYVYMLEDKETHNQYVGQHVLMENGVLKRANTYFTGGKIPNNIIRKYGRNRFSRKVIAWTTDLNELTTLEYQYINEIPVERRLNISLSPESATGHRRDIDYPVNKSYKNVGNVHCFNPQNLNERTCCKPEYIPEGWQQGCIGSLFRKTPVYHHTETTLQKISNSSKKHWQDPVYREKVLASRKEYFQTHAAWNKGKHTQYSEEGLKAQLDSKERKMQRFREELSKNGLVSVKDLMKETGLTRAKILNRYNTFEYYIGKQKFLVVKKGEEPHFTENRGKWKR